MVFGIVALLGTLYDTILVVKVPERLLTMFPSAWVRCIQ